MPQREARVKRATNETEVEIQLNLDGSGRFAGKLELGFLEHMLTLLAHHGRLDLKLRAQGDLRTDDHHLTEDLGIVLGQALDQALGGRRGIERYGHVLLPMDEVLVAVALDLGGRFAFACDYAPRRERVGDFSTEMAPHFFRSMACQARAALHLQFLNPGVNEHHRVEAMFKGFGLALRMAVRRSQNRAKQIPSTKGVL